MQDTRKEQLLKFCQSLGIEMHKLELLNSALTHTSYAHESKELPRPEHNERVEFLGDSVLSVIVSTYMYCTFPNLNEGELTKLRAHIVCEASLAEYARKINLSVNIISLAERVIAPIKLSRFSIAFLRKSSTSIFPSGSVAVTRILKPAIVLEAGFVP